MLLPVWPGLNFWYILGVISSPSWFFSLLSMDFFKKTSGFVFTFLISALVLLWSAGNFVASKLYFSLRRNPNTDRFFRGYQRAGKTFGYALLYFGNVGLYHFSEKSVASILTFLFLALYCLCTLFCIQPYTDFGTIEFLLSASMNQTLSLFGLRSSYSWLVIIACIVIAGIRYHLEPTHPPGSGATSDEDQLGSGQLLPITSKKEDPPPPRMGGQGEKDIEQDMILRWERLSESLMFVSAQEEDIRAKLHSQMLQMWKIPKKEVEVWLGDVASLKVNVQILELEVFGEIRDYPRVLLGKILDKTIHGGRTP